MHTNQNPRNNVPAAWYDLSCRISSAKAVMSCIGESVSFVKGDAEQAKAANHTCYLSGAVMDLLEMCEQDINRLERQLLASEN